MAPRSAHLWSNRAQDLLSRIIHSVNRFCRPDFLTSLKLNCASLQNVCFGLGPRGSGITSPIWTSLKVSSTSRLQSPRTADRAAGVTADSLLLCIHLVRLTFATAADGFEEALGSHSRTRVAGRAFNPKSECKMQRHSGRGGQPSNTQVCDVNWNSRGRFIGANRLALYLLLQLANSEPTV